MVWGLVESGAQGPGSSVLRDLESGVWGLESLEAMVWSLVGSGAQGPGSHVLRGLDIWYCDFAFWSGELS